MVAINIQLRIRAVYHRKNRKTAKTSAPYLKFSGSSNNGPALPQPPQATCMYRPRRGEKYVLFRKIQIMPNELHYFIACQCVWYNVYTIVLRGRTVRHGDFTCLSVCSLSIIHKDGLHRNNPYQDQIEYSKSENPSNHERHTNADQEFIPNESEYIIFYSCGE